MWTIVIATSLTWNIVLVRQETLETARIQAKAAYEKDIIYRCWNTLHGGVYVPVTRETKPNPYLSDIPERDITTPSGKLLTLMNPAYMTRQVHELLDEECGIRGHITSLNPIRPQNAPDPWETKALQGFERGETETSSVEEIEGREHMRLMCPLITEKGCLRCHAAYGSREGDIRGGISVSIPMEPLWAIGHRYTLRLVLGHGLLWLIGLGGIAFVMQRLTRSEQERNKTKEALKKYAEQLKQRVSERTVKLEDRTFELETANERLNKEIIERRRAEEKLAKYRDHLEELIKERTVELEKSQIALVNIVEDLNMTTEKLKHANERLQELDQLKSMFIASMSHELRTPLNSIIGFTGIILQGMTGEINAEQKDQLQRVYDSAKHLLALITDIIDVSKIEAGKVEVYAKKININEVIKEAISSLKPEIDNKGLGLETSLPPDLQLTTDRKRLLQCILNYLSNAVKFTEKGEIMISAFEIDGMVEIRVKDTGTGIKEEDIPKLFKSFARLDTPLKTTIQGTGLGLYLTKKIATEVLKGSVSVESKYGEGSTFVIRVAKEI
ncbi:MAG: DUF3365 domain-containing protein [Deltaproteobacteria bacterium]|nr:DUF3365 domain-containing protein [Deltaproteobacteria bacterium]